MYGGELFDRLILRGAYTENEARQTFVQVAQGLLYLHGFVPVPPFALPNPNVAPPVRSWDLHVTLLHVLVALCVVWCFARQCAWLPA